MSYWKLLPEIELPVPIGGIQVFTVASTEYCTGQKTFYDHDEVITKEMLDSVPSKGSHQYHEASQILQRALQEGGANMRNTSSEDTKSIQVL